MIDSLSVKFRVLNLITFFLLSLNPVQVYAAQEGEPADEPTSILGKMKAAPKAVSDKADVVVEWVEPIDDCDPEKICVQGGIQNLGRSTAYNVKLRIEIGGSKTIRH